MLESSESEAEAIVANGASELVDCGGSPLRSEPASPVSSIADQSLLESPSTYYSPTNPGDQDQLLDQPLSSSEDTVVSAALLESDSRSDLFRADHSGTEMAVCDRPPQEAPRRRVGRPRKDGLGPTELPQALGASEPSDARMDGALIPYEASTAGTPQGQWERVR